MYASFLSRNILVWQLDKGCQNNVGRQTHEVITFITWSDYIHLEITNISSPLISYDSKLIRGECLNQYPEVVHKNFEDYFKITQIL